MSRKDRQEAKQEVVEQTKPVHWDEDEIVISEDDKTSLISLDNDMPSNLETSAQQSLIDEVQKKPADSTWNDDEIEISDEEITERKELPTAD